MGTSAKILLNISAFIGVASITASPVLGAAIQHKDIKNLNISGSLDVFGGTWSVESRLNFLTAEPHITPVGGVTQFQSINIFTASASSFTPLFVPGDPTDPQFNPGPGDNLADRNYEIDLNLTGPGIFDYSNAWTVKIEDNMRNATVVYNFSLNIAPTLTVGPVGGSIGGFGINVNYTPPPVGGVLFSQLALPKDFNIILTTTKTSEQGFFASGGRIEVGGFVKDTAPGTTRILYDNKHFATGKGLFVYDFTRAAGTGSVRTEVYDETTSIKVPEPSSILSILALGTLGAASTLKRKLKSSKSSEKETTKVS